MRIDTLAVDLRPRPMPEAADLGVLLVQRHARSVWRCFTPVWAACTLLALACTTVSPWLALAVQMTLRPWLDRGLLFVLARAVFGQATRFEDLWQQRASVLWRQLPATLLWRWTSPWRSFVQPIHQLENQRGKAGRARRKLLLKGRHGSALAMQSAFALTELALSIGLVALPFWLAADGASRPLARWLFEPHNLSAQLLMTASSGLILLLIEPFFVAAGFLMYLNRRVELEAWDIEQEFRRAFT